MIRDWFLEHNGDSRPWTLWFGLILVVLVCLPACAPAITRNLPEPTVSPATSESWTMTASRNPTTGKIDTIFTRSYSSQSIGAVRAGLQSQWIEANKAVGVAKANNPGLRFSSSYDPQYGNYSYGPSIMIGGGIGGNPDATCRNQSGDYVRCSSIRGSNIPFGTQTTSRSNDGSNVVFKK